MNKHRLLNETSSKEHFLYRRMYIILVEVDQMKKKTPSNLNTKFLFSWLIEIITALALTYCGYAPWRNLSSSNAPRNMLMHLTLWYSIRFWQCHNQQPQHTRVHTNLWRAHFNFLHFFITVFHYVLRIVTNSTTNSTKTRIQIE